MTVSRTLKAHCALTLLLCVALLNSCGAKNAAAGAPQMPPPEVEVASVAQEDVQVRNEWVATIDGNVNAQIQAQVMGYLIKQQYQEGAFVRKDQILFEIDPRPFQAVVDQTAGQLAQAEGQVAQAESQVTQAESQVAQAAAQLAKAEQDVKRDSPLVQARAIAQSQLDAELQAKAAAEAAWKASKANVGVSLAGVKSAQAAVKVAKANLAQAELNLGFTKVRSLIDGIAGVAQTQIGNLVKNDTVLTTVSQLNPFRVYFPISEHEYLTLSSTLLKNHQAAPLQLILGNGKVYEHPGRVSFADRQVDSQTGTIRMAATFANPGNVMRPGQFGRIRAQTGEQKGALLIPQRAVTELQGKQQVALVGADNKVQIRTIKLGQSVGSRYVVEHGLQVGDRVIVEGLAKAMDGGMVVPKATPVQKAESETGIQGR
ncbi:efflux RND transporter periplasmic adaptor subunit [Bryobacter aggregatus]|uniref:efflux RND transporter periplasmic adaptor subunit n=1 Tax=Bryobacter aggregatus TaxID=360054 RepID=UPI0006916CAA|nr:efflux RND transporter periplasmic adaptor subunit [Bryobacter aggregatus]